MKIPLNLICILVLVSSSALAEHQELFPDLSKALRGGVVVHKANAEVLEGYRLKYGENLDFNKLRNELKEFLGKSWKEEKVDPEKDRLLKLVMKQQGVNLEGFSVFSKSLFPGHQIILTKKSEEVEGKKWCFVDISGTWNKADRAHQPANAPKKK